MLNIKIVSWSLGIFYRHQLRPVRHLGIDRPAKLTHMAAVLGVAFLAFKWLTFGGFCLGLIESFSATYTPDSCSSPSTTFWPAGGVCRQSSSYTSDRP